MKRDLVIVLVGRVLQMVTSVLLAKILTSVLTPYEMGKYSVIITLISLFALLLINPVGTYFNRKTHEWHKEGLLLAFFISYTKYIIVIAAVAVVIIVALYKLVDVFQNQFTLSWLIILVAWSLIFNTLNQTVIPTLNLLEKRIVATVLSVISIWAGLLFSFLFTIENGSSEYWYAGQMTGFTLAFLIAIPFFMKVSRENCLDNKIYEKPKIQYRELLIFCVPVSITVGMTWIQFQSYRFLISDLISLEFLGFFTAGYTLSASIIAAFETTMMQFFYPIIYKKISNSTEEVKLLTWNRYAECIFPIAILTMAMVCFFSKPLTSILLASEYKSVYNFVIWGGLVEFGRLLGNVYGMVAHATLKTKSLIIPQSIGAISSVILVYYCSVNFGGDSIGWSLFSASLIYLLAMHISMRKILKIRLPYKRIGHSFLASAGLGIIGYFFNKSEGYIPFIGLLIAGILYLVYSYFFIRRYIKDDGKNIAESSS